MRALLLLPLLFSLGVGAPRSGSRSEQSEHINKSNPLSPGEEHLRDLYRYLQEKDPLGENDPNMTRETALLHLFVLHDYDKSGHLDGLELMQMLYGVLSDDREKPSEEQVISIVDEVLAKQDVGGDGLLSAQELVSAVGYEDPENVDSADVGGPAVDSDLSKEPAEDPPQEVSSEPAEEAASQDHEAAEAVSRDNDHEATETVSRDHEAAEAVSRDNDHEATEEVNIEVDTEEVLTEGDDNKPDHEM